MRCIASVFITALIRFHHYITVLIPWILRFQFNFSSMVKSQQQILNYNRFLVFTGRERTDGTVAKQCIIATSRHRLMKPVYR